MSVLLEALKKAAEEKKKALANAESIQSAPSDKTSSESGLTLSSSSTESPNPVDSKESSSNMASLSSADHNETPLDFKLTLDAPSETSPSIESDKSTSSKPIETISTETNEASTFKLALTESSDAKLESDAINSEVVDIDTETETEVIQSEPPALKLVLDEPAAVKAFVDVDELEHSISLNKDELSPDSESTLTESFETKATEESEPSNEVESFSDKADATSKDTSFNLVPPAFEDQSSIHDLSDQKNNEDPATVSPVMIPTEEQYTSESIESVGNSTDSSFVKEEVPQAGIRESEAPNAHGLNDLSINEEVHGDQGNIPTQNESAALLAPLSGEKALTVDQKTSELANKEDSNSYEWSLDALPGYSDQKEGEKAALSPNPILASGALSAPAKKTSGKRSLKIFSILVVLLVLIGIILYGLIYYQEQNELLEQRMQKYNISKPKITVTREVSKAEPVINNSNSVDAAIDSVASEKAVAESEDLSDVVSKPSSVPSNISSAKTAAVNNLDPVATKQSKEIPVIKSENDKPRIAVERVKSKEPKTTALEPTQANVIVHSESDILSEAYLAYEQGDYYQAKNSFEEVLNINPKSEFALIGLGGISASNHQYVLAMEYYQKALAIQPESLHAFEAIANISGHVGLNSEWKTALISMAQNYPDSAVLQNALGNLYSLEKNWLAAQEAYFQAYSLEIDNADYQVNLAISLDQLGQYALAAQHYTQALALVGNRPINFNEEDIKQRLISIRQFLSGGNQ